MWIMCFQADDCDAYDSDVDEAPTAQTMFQWSNLSICMIQFVIEAEHKMQDDVQPNHVVESHADYTSDSNMTPYDQYVKDNDALVIQNNASMVPNDAYVMIDNDVHKSDVLSVSHTPRNTVANNLLKNKYLEEFLDLKALKDKVEDKLFKQGQSIQTVHMMCKPRSYYDEVNKVAIGYKNPQCLYRARQVQPALYSGHVIVTPNHAPAVVRDYEETLEQSEISRKKTHDKMKANECVDNNVKITPPNYSKENFLATFTPQKQLTPE
ncbi:hypothetical protein Tco_0185409 [Tanacetum coccineum]